MDIETVIMAQIREEIRTQIEEQKNSPASAKIINENVNVDEAASLLFRDIVGSGNGSISDECINILAFSGPNRERLKACRSYLAEELINLIKTERDTLYNVKSDIVSFKLLKDEAASGKQLPIETAKLIALHYKKNILVIAGTNPKDTSWALLYPHNEEKEFGISQEMLFSDNGREIIENSIRICGRKGHYCALIPKPK
jgi:hypothetical protein